MLSNQGKNSWFNVIKRTCDFGDIEINSIETVDLEKVFKSIFKTNWQREREKSLIEGKLRLLSLCKKDFILSLYLASKIFPAYKKAI